MSVFFWKELSILGSKVHREPITILPKFQQHLTLFVIVFSRFETTALHQTNVKLTWDETDNHRIKTTMRAFNKDELEDMDFEAYLASSSDDDDDDNHDFDDKDIDEDGNIAKYKVMKQYTSS